MSDNSINEQLTTASPSLEQTVHRILAAVEKDRRRGRLEVALAIIMSLATLCTTWCGYQANQWGGAAGSDQAAADTAERKAAEDTIVGLQIRTFEGIEMLAYWSALRENDTETSNAIFARMRPPVQKALKASLDAGVLHDPTVPGPLKRPEYVIAEEVEAARLRTEAARLNTRAKSAGQTGGSYVLLTLMFASVLFFGGITSTFTWRKVRIALGFVAIILFLATVGLLTGLPVFAG